MIEIRRRWTEKLFWIDLPNATEDLQYIATRGSRKGIHLLLGVNSYSDLKQTGLKLDWFLYR